MDTMPGMLWTKERVEKWLREHGASGDMSLAVVLASDIVYDYEAQLSNQYQRIGRFVELVDQLEAQLAQRWEPLPDGTYNADHEGDSFILHAGFLCVEETDIATSEKRNAEIALPENYALCRRVTKGESDE